MPRKASQRSDPHFKISGLHKQAPESLISHHTHTHEGAGKAEKQNRDGGENVRKDSRQNLS